MHEDKVGEMLKRVNEPWRLGWGDGAILERLNARGVGVWRLAAEKLENPDLESGLGG